MVWDSVVLVSASVSCRSVCFRHPSSRFCSLFPRWGHMMSGVTFQKTAEACAAMSTRALCAPGYVIVPEETVT